ncbi:MAG: xanthine dehydrogenase family protein molybdopterin-binding subunit [Spirochaetaceae bacterium]|nr:xanthine dehydrogenase family protein molybdopterin-binding subunit [Spirochaetaceae bacterium]MCF7947346.1 xanthine dehydrogenase family protein molybdopterin-binding subunit [Spirochaetia bacterium]MCF7951281.1 xanthine dehydrogenase family protein molybdopterin-binding subunit [Spirochaetaceae bacterium]
MNKKISTSIKRVDAGIKTGGAARYIGDIPFDGLLYGKIVRSSRARATIKSVSVPALPEGYYYIDAKDIPSGGRNRIEMIKDDWPVFADEQVRFIGETLGLLVGPDRKELNRLRDEVQVEYEDLTPVFSIEESEALKGGPIHGEDNTYADYRLKKGDPDAAFAKAARVIEDTVRTGFQEHIYMEPQGVVARTEDDGKLGIFFSGQCPFYVRHAVSATMGVPEDQVRVQQAVTGGAFGGKEHYPDVISTPLAVAARKIGKPIGLFFDRVEDISFTPKRHPSVTRFKTALDEEGNILGMDIDVRIDAGAYESCSMVVLQRAIFSVNSVYNIPNVKIRGRAFATNNVPSDAYRGFGAPQGLFAIEAHMSHLARAIKVDELKLKQQYLLKQGDVTVTNGRIHEEVKLPEIIQRIDEMSGYSKKLKEYTPGSWKGVGVSLFNHGSGFTGNGEQEIIKGVVKMRKRADGLVDLLVSNVEMGQGLQTTFRKIAAMVLELPVDSVVYNDPNTDLVPDSGPTCASRSIAVVGYLVQEAAKKLKDRWKESDIVEVRQQYEPPEGLIPWDQANLQGDAYPSYGWGANVIEVEVDPLTYEVTTKGIWAVHDVGVAIDEKVVEGQVDGGIIQALGYGSLEKLEVKEGRFQQKTMADYTIPTTMDFPKIKSALVDNPYEYGPFGAKGAGELVFDGAAAAFADAVQMAINGDVKQIPVTPEYIMEVREDGNN